MKSENLISLYAAINQLMIRMQANTNLLEQENAKLKAQLANTRLGLEKVYDYLIRDDDYYITWDDQFNLYVVSENDGCPILEAPNLADLVDAVALMEVE